MSEGFFNKLMKKGFDVQLGERPIGTEAFIDEIEKYCVKEKLKFEFIEKNKPVIIVIDDITYKCELRHIGRGGWSLIFKEI